jgi:glucosamine--fructose-6-phosphate aminotransferase (isomerizing)
MDNGHYTREEIFSQPDVWISGIEIIRSQANEIREFYRKGKYDYILFTGCGSTYYLSLAAASSFTELNGKVARGLPASELWLNPSFVYPQEGKCLLVAVSRSGSTTETLRACEAFSAQKRGDIFTISCYPEAPLARMGALNLVFPDSREESIAQTRSFSTLFLATIATSALWNDKQDLVKDLIQLPDLARRLIKENGEKIRLLAQDPHLERFYFLGSGSRYGLASEISLKMKEMSLSHSEPFHFLEFRHGPMSMVNKQTFLMGMVSEKNKAFEIKVLDEMKSRGANVLSLGEGSTDITFNSDVSEAVRDVLYLPLGQLFALERSLHKGLNPDKPNNLDAVVILDK